MNYNNTPIKLPAIRDRGFHSPERPLNGLSHLVSPVQNKHKQFNFSGAPQQNYGAPLIRQVSDSNRSIHADGPPQGLNLSLAKMSSFANKAERNLNDSNVFNNSYQSPFPQKSPLPLQSKSKGQFSSFGKEKQFTSESSFHHNPPQFNESINYGSPLLDQQHSKMYINSDSNPSLFQKKIGPKSFSSSKLLKGISQVPGGLNSGARFNANYEADSSFAHPENQTNISSLRINKFKSQGSIQLPELSPPGHFENNNSHHNNVQLPAIQKSHFGFNQGMLNSYDISTDRSHRRMGSLPSDQAIANVLNGSFNVQHQPSSVGQTYQNLNEITKEKSHHKPMKPLPTEQLIGLPIYQGQNSTRVNGYENDIDYLKYLMAQGSASTDTTPKHQFTKTSLDDKEKKKKKKKEKKPKAKPVSPPKIEEPVKKEPVDKEKKLKKVVIRENHRLLERELERERIERVRGNMRSLLWIMAFPRLLRNRIMDFVDEKRLEVNKSAKQDIKDVVNSVSNFIKKNCFTYLQLLYDKKQALNIVPYDKKAKKDLNKKSIEQRSKLISTSLLSILTSVMNATINHEIPMEIIEFFASITENLSVVPTGFLFPFEINRLELTQFLTLKNMNPMRSKMMIGMFFLIRMLVFYFLTQPWNAKVKVTETPLLLENLKICSSVLYHVIFNFFRKRLPIVKNHENSQESEKKLKPRNGLLFCFGASERPDEPVTEDEVIIGLFSRSALNDYFLLEKGAVEEMNDIIEQWLDVVYTKVQVHQVCLEKPAGKQKAIFE